MAFPNMPGNPVGAIETAGGGGGGGGAGGGDCWEPGLLPPPAIAAIAVAKAANN